MEAKNILKTNYLDILFENKNKEYGAYPLRKFYHQRIKKSLGITFMLVVVFASFQSWRMSRKVASVRVDPIVEITLDPYKKEKELPKEKPKEQKIAKQVAQVNTTTPQIVPDDKFIKPMPTIDDIDTSLAGPTTVIGTRDSGFVNVTPGPPQTPPSIGNNPTVTPVEPEEENPLYNPSVMPEFPGGLDAFKHYMIRNLTQPDDIEEGQKIMVLVKFVVGKTGHIRDIEIVHSGREDLDAEVIRVVKRMPAWKPGLQNGLPVEVYYKIPVTFAAIN